MGKSTKKFIAWLLVSVIVLAGVFGALWHFTDVLKPSAEPPAEETPGDNDTPESNVLSIMPRSLEASTAESNTVELKAVISPSIASQPVTWAMAWENSLSDWASGKSLDDYLEIVPSQDTLTANVNCLQSFGEPIIVTCAVKADATIKATCKVDYAQRLDVNFNYEFVERADTFPMEDIQGGYNETLKLNDEKQVFDLYNGSNVLATYPTEDLVLTEGTINVYGELTYAFSYVFNEEFLSEIIGSPLLDTDKTGLGWASDLNETRSGYVSPNYSNIEYFLNKLGYKAKTGLNDEDFKNLVYSKMLNLTEINEWIYKVYVKVFDGETVVTTKTGYVCISKASLLEATGITLNKDNIVF